MLFGVAAPVAAPILDVTLDLWSSSVKACDWGQQKWSSSATNASRHACPYGKQSHSINDRLEGLKIIDQISKSKKT